MPRQDGFGASEGILPHLVRPSLDIGEAHQSQGEEAVQDAPPQTVTQSPP